MATGLVLAGCASLEQKTTDSWLTTKWDKEAKSTAILYFEEDIGIYKVDGKANVNIYKQEVAIDGSGTVKAPKAANVNIYKQEVAIDGSGTVKAPKARLIIPSGDRVLTIGIKEMTAGIAKTYGERRYEVPYTFVGGRFYQLATSENKDFKNPKLVELDKQMKEAEDKAVALANQAETAEKNNNRAEALRLGAEAQKYAPEVLRLGLEKNKVLAAEDEYARNVEIIDITGGKKKNSPSSVVVVKPWEKK